ncbi:MAG: VTT domain-containing protein [Dehalococcoidia bacterium]
MGARRDIARAAVRLLVVLAVVGLLSLAAERIFDISVDDIEEAIDAAGVLAPIIYAFVLFLGLSVPFNPVSDLATVNVAALVFPPTVSIPATFAAHTMALALNYAVGRWYGDTLLRRVASQRGAAAIEALGSDFSYRALFLLRFALPLTAIGIDFVSYFCGMRRLPFLRFYAVSMVPWTVLSIVFFTSTSMFKDRSLVLFFVPTAVLIIGPTLILFLRRRARRSRSREA